MGIQKKIKRNNAYEKIVKLNEMLSGIDLVPLKQDEEGIYVYIEKLRAFICIRFNTSINYDLMKILKISGLIDGGEKCDRCRKKPVDKRYKTRICVICLKAFCYKCDQSKDYNKYSKCPFCNKIKMVKNDN